MSDLDDLDQLVRYDSQGRLARAAVWQERLEGNDELLSVAKDIDAAWLASCRPDAVQAHNPAKQLAVQLLDRVPLIWASAGLAGVAQSWQQRIQRYAEAAALSASVDEMARDWSMARFPRFWNNVLVCVYLAGGAEGEEERTLAGRMQALLRQRRVQSISAVLPAGHTPIAAAFHATELGEWVALYLAALYNVDPADRVPWQYLGIEGVTW